MKDKIVPKYALKYVFFFLLSVGIFSCKKEEVVLVKITVYDIFAGRNVPNQYVTLIQQGTKHSLFSGGSSDSRDLINKGYTNSNGQIVFVLDEDYNKYSYFIGYENQGNYTYISGADDAISKGDVNITVKVYAYSKLILTLNPPPPYNAGDSLRVDFYCPNNNTNGQHNILRNSNYTSATNFFWVEYGTYYFNIDKYKAGVYSNIRDTVFYTDDSTYFYNVNW